MEPIDIIRDYVVKTLLQRSSTGFTDDSHLIEEGFISERETVDLAVFLEESFGIEIEFEELEEDFDSIRSVADLVERKLQAKVQA